MKVCFVTSQIFAFGKYGGFGSMTRTIGRELVKRGVKVCAVVPRHENQKPVETLDGMTVYGYTPSLFWMASKPYKICDADIYHSQEPTFGTYLALKTMPDRKHIVTCIDPRDADDWKVEFRFSSFKRKLLFPMSYIYESGPFVNKAVRNAHVVYCQTKFIIPKSMKIYGLTTTPGFLPNPIDVPKRELKKASKPTVFFLARLDRRKRPEIFFELAKSFPGVKFIAVGKAHDEQWDRYLRDTYAALPNLEMTGFLDFFTSDRLKEIIEQGWILINTAAREGLPSAFVEAAAHKCAILSSVNPDDFASNFGYYAQKDDFEAGLEYLLENDRWKERAEEGYQYIKETYETAKVIDKHIEVYEALLRG